MKNRTIFYLWYFCIPLMSYSDGMFGSIDSVIENRKAYYDFNGSVDIPVIKKDTDMIKESEIILNNELMDRLKDKKTQEELRLSMAKLEDAEESKAGELSKTKRYLKIEEIDTSRIKLLKKGASPSRKQAPKKSKILQNLYYGKGI